MFITGRELIVWTHLCRQNLKVPATPLIITISFYQISPDSNVTLGGYNLADMAWLFIAATHADGIVKNGYM
jgi:hypothetical protein